MKTLIAGGAGYIGSTVASACLDAGICPVIVDSLVTGRREFTAGRAFYQGDIADGSLNRPDLRRAPRHLRGRSLRGADRGAGFGRGPSGVLAGERGQEPGVCRTPAAQRVRSAGLQFLGCDLSGRGGPDRDEDSPVDPQSPYARTKAVCEAMLADIAATQPIRVLSLRYFNPVGADPKMRTGLQLARPTHALGQIIRAHQEGVPFVITGTDWPTRDGTGLRDYVHVWDLAAAHVAALRRFDSLPGQTTAVNLGSGTGTTVRELLGAFSEVTGLPVQVREAGRRPGDMAGACTRIGRAERLLDWRPRYDLAEGINHSLQWAALREEILPEGQLIAPEH